MLHRLRFVSRLRIVAILLASPAALAAQQTITDFVGCLNTKLVVAGNLASNDVNNVNISDTVQCLPQGCKLTLTISGFSDQKAGIDQNTGTQMPRIMLNCPGPGDGRRVRPAYTLLVQGPPTKTIEFAEDASPSPPAANLVMSQIQVDPGVAWNKPDPLGTIDTMNTPKQCTNCHTINLNPFPTAKYPAVAANQVDAFLEPPNDPFGIARKFGGTVNVLPFVVDTTEPNRKAMVNPQAPGKKQTLASICTDIDTGLKAGAFTSNPLPNLALCQALAAYQKNTGCGTGKDGGVNPRSCNGVTGGGTYKNAQGDISTVSVDFSGQATMIAAGGATNIVFLDRDGTFQATNYTKRVVITSAVLMQLTGTKQANGDLSFTGAGTAQVSMAGAAAKQTNVSITMTNTGGVVAYKITDTGANAVLVDAATPIFGSALVMN